MDKLARWVGDNPRRRLEDELMDRINRHRRIRSEFRPMVQGVMRLEKEFGAEKQFHWLRAALSSKKEPLETEWVHWDPLNSYAELFEEYINPTGTGLWRGVVQPFEPQGRCPGCYADRHRVQVLSWRWSR